MNAFTERDAWLCPISPFPVTIPGMRDGYIKVGSVSPHVIVADTVSNACRTVELVRQADGKGVKVLVFPELSLTGYTLGDLVFSPDLLQGALRALEKVCEETRDLDALAVVGLPLQDHGKLYNTAAVIHHGRVLAFVPKTNIPSYGEFYEGRWYEGAFDGIRTVRFADYDVPFGRDIIIRTPLPSSFALAVELCEDLWVPQSPSVSHAMAGATVIANLSASDELIGKDDYRRDLVRLHSARLMCGYIYSNAGEGESSTDMVFAGHSMIVEDGTVLAEQMLAGERILVSEIDTSYIASERMKHTTFTSTDVGSHMEVWTRFDECETYLTRTYPRFPFVPRDEGEVAKRAERIVTLQALGLKKRLEHTRSKGAVVGLSGGLDSTLALLVTVRAFDMLSRDRKDILAITMPCFGTTKRTRSNAEILATALGVSFEEVDITASVRSHFKDIGQKEDVYDVTFENAQARERTQVLMDKANMSGSLVIGTGDLSELALGWATYNGDHMSMYAVNASVPKTLVRHLVHWFASCDASCHDVLEDILDTPVSPELLPANADGTIAQVTEDLVGPYELHDFFLYYFVRASFTREKIRRIAYRTFEGVYDRAVVDRWLDNFFRRFFSQQFKRSCLPDGPKVGSVTLSPRSDWRMPSDASSALWR